MLAILYKCSRRLTAAAVWEPSSARGMLLLLVCSAQSLRAPMPVILQYAVPYDQAVGLTATRARTNLGLAQVRPQDLEVRLEGRRCIVAATRQAALAV